MKKRITFLIFVLFLIFGSANTASAKTVKTAPIEYDMYVHLENTLVSRFGEVNLGTPFFIPGNSDLRTIVFPVIENEQVVATLELSGDSKFFYTVGGLLSKELNTLAGPMLFFRADANYYVANEDGIQEVAIFHRTPVEEYTALLNEFKDICTMEVNIYDNVDKVDRIFKNIPYYVSVSYGGFQEKAVVINSKIFIPVSVLSEIDPAITVHWNAESKKVFIDFTKSAMPSLAIASVEYDSKLDISSIIYKNNTVMHKDEQVLLVSGRSFISIDLIEAYANYTLSEGVLTLLDK